MSNVLFLKLPSYPLQLSWLKADKMVSLKWEHTNNVTNKKIFEKKQFLYDVFPDPFEIMLYLIAQTEGSGVDLTTAAGCLRLRRLLRLKGCDVPLHILRNQDFRDLSDGKQLNFENQFWKLWN